MDINIDEDEFMEIRFVKKPKMVGVSKWTAEVIFDYTEENLGMIHKSFTIPAPNYEILEQELISLYENYKPVKTDIMKMEEAKASRGIKIKKTS